MASDAAEYAAMLADLSDERREQLAVPDAPRNLDNDPRTVATSRFASRAETIRREAEGGDRVAINRADWYPIGIPEDERDLFGGQGHRGPLSEAMQGQQGNGPPQQRGPYGRSSARPSPGSMRGNQGPPQTRAAVRRTVAPASVRQRAPSPRAFGKVRYTNEPNNSLSKTILPATGVRRTLTTASRIAAHANATREFASTLASTSTIAGPASTAVQPSSTNTFSNTPPATRPAMVEHPTVRQAAPANGPSASTAQRSVIQASPSPVPAPKALASSTSSAGSGNGIVRVPANAFAAQRLMANNGMHVVIIGSEEDRRLQDASNSQSTRQAPAQARTHQASPSQALPPQAPTPHARAQQSSSTHLMASHEPPHPPPAAVRAVTPPQATPTTQAPPPSTQAPPAERSGVRALLPQLNPAGAAARLLGSIGVIAAPARDPLPPVLTPPSFPTGGRPYHGPHATGSFSGTSSQDQAFERAEAQTMPAQTNNFAMAPPASHPTNGTTASDRSHLTNGHTSSAPAPHAAVTAPHMSARPSSSSIQRMPTRDSVVNNLLAAAGLRTAQPSSQDVVMGGTTATSTPPAADSFTFTARPAGNGVIPITRAGVNPETDPLRFPIFQMQAEAYASNLSAESAVSRDQYYERFPLRRRFLDEARAILIASGRPIDLDAMEQDKHVEAGNTVEQEEAEVKMEETEVEQEETEVTSPVTRSSTSTTIVPPHLLNSGTTPARSAPAAGFTPPHLAYANVTSARSVSVSSNTVTSARRAVVGIAPTIAPSAVTPSPSATPAATSTPARTTRAEVGSSANSRPRSDSSTSSHSTNLSVPTPAAHAQDSHVAAAIANANAANIRQGRLNVTFHNQDGDFLGNRGHNIDAPVQASLTITSRHGEYNPLDLADSMAAIAALMRLKIDGVSLKRKENGDWEENQQA